MHKYELSVSVQPAFVPEQSDPENHLFFFSYTIRITNTGNVATQLISRHWIIEDASSHTEEIKGLGVVGHQPLLQPGESFEYTSGCPLETPHGSMRGSFFCVAEDGTRFEAPVAEFALAVPHTVH